RTPPSGIPGAGGDVREHGSLPAGDCEAVSRTLAPHGVPRRSHRARWPGERGIGGGARRRGCAGPADIAASRTLGGGAGARLTLLTERRVHLPHLAFPPHWEQGVPWLMPRVTTIREASARERPAPSAG